jgi:prolipoprotein diacylglyceryltransferase
LFEWRGLRILSYPAMGYVGLTLGVISGIEVARYSGANVADVFIAIMAVAVVGMIGARLFFIAIHWPIYRREPSKIWRRGEGGGAVLGALVLAIALSPAVLAPLGLSFGAFWDIATVVMLIWSIFGRVGCLLHGCCSGRVSDGALAIDLPDHCGIWRRRIPTQFLEIALAASILIAVAALWHLRPYSGAVFLAALAAYGLGRGVLQPLRDERDRIGGFDIHRTIAVGGSALSLITLVVLSLRH